MSARIAYLTRADRGAHVTGVRLVGAHADESWTPPESGPGSPSERAARASHDAARWIASRLSAKKMGSLGALCVDADGGVCTWISSPSPEPQLIGMMAREGPATDDATGSTPAPTPLSYFAESVRDSQVQGLVPPPAGSRTQGAPQRVGVLAVGDLATRLVLDELDDAGVGVDQVTTLWHAMAAAWDPSARRPVSGAEPADGLLAENTSLTLVVLVEPAGRLVWCWSRAGLLLAAGAVRLAMVRADDDPDAAPRLLIAESDLARLGAEWISWGMQLGASPARAVCILPPGGETVEGEAGLRSMGEALSSRLGNVPVDAALHDDPVGATLLRLLAREDDRADLASDPRAGLVSLSHRPTRAHRRLYFWAAAAVLLMALGTAIAAWRLEASARVADAAARQTRDKITTLVEQVHKPAMMNPAGVALALQSELAALQRRVAPPDKPDPTQPILAELDALSGVLGAAEIELQELSLTNTSVTVRVLTPDLPTAELVADALRSVGGSSVGQWTPTFTQQPGGKVSAQFNGRWIAAERPRPAGGTS